MNRRLLAEFAGRMRDMSNDDLRAIAADSATQTYSREYVMAAVGELSRRGVAPLANANAEHEVVLSYSRDYPRKSQPLYWFGLVIILLTLMLVLLTIWHAHYVRAKVGG